MNAFLIYFTKQSINDLKLIVNSIAQVLSWENIQKLWICLTFKKIFKNYGFVWHSRKYSEIMDLFDIQELQLKKHDQVLLYNFEYMLLLITLKKSCAGFFRNLAVFEISNFFDQGQFWLVESLTKDNYILIQTFPWKMCTRFYRAFFLRASVPNFKVHDTCFRSWSSQNEVLEHIHC